MSNGTRPDWDDYFISLAYLVSTRATCDRKKVGAILVNKRRIIATGYNGAPAGMPECDDFGHELKTIDGRESCVRTLHAESNAIDFAGKEAKGSILYTTVIPCYDCAKRIVNAGVTNVVYAEYYTSRNTELVIEYFQKSESRKQPCLLHKWEGELISPSHVSEGVLKRTAAIQGRRIVSDE